MTDLFFSVNDRDLLIEDGDFALIDNISVQAGAILKECRVISQGNPIYGIGLMETINDPVSKAYYEMTRWAKQAKDDGAGIARFKITNDATDKVTNIDIEISYE